MKSIILESHLSSKTKYLAEIGKLLQTKLFNEDKDITSIHKYWIILSILFQSMEKHEKHNNKMAKIG